MIGIDVPTIITNAVKGGTGKTLFTTNLADRLSESMNVGVLDADIDSPNLPEVMAVDKVMGLDRETRQYIPIEVSKSLKLFSMAAFVDKDVVTFTNVGSQSSQIIRDAIRGTEWGDIDILIVDLPAGSADSFREVMRVSNVIGMFVVTLPSTVIDFRRAIRLGEMFGIPMLGVVENMMSVACKCGNVIPLYGNSDIEDICDEYGFEYMGGIPYYEDLHDATYSSYYIPNDITDVFKNAIGVIARQ